MKYVLCGIGVVLGGLLVSACECTRYYTCGSGMQFVVHLPPVGRPGLEGATVTACRNGGCSSGVPVWIDGQQDPQARRDGWEDANITFGGPIEAAGRITVTPDGRGTLGVGTFFEQGGKARDGDLYELRVADAVGKTIIDFSRRLRYLRSRPPSGECGPTCYVGSVRVWPSSANGLTCGSAVCATSVSLHIEAPLPGGLRDGTSVDVCRNGVCSRAVWPRAMFDGTLGVRAPPPSNFVRDIWTFHLSIEEDPAVLANGDVYQVTVTDSEGKIAATINEAVTYEESFPNGRSCDAFPCRSALLTRAE